jgi:protein-tyrosine phosphatase
MMLNGQPNFRDLGGYASSSGRTVRTGQVFRSGDFSALTEDDLEHLDELRIRTVVDLRSEPEASARPDRLPRSASYVPLRVLPAVDNSTMEEMFRTGDFHNFPPWETIYRSGVRDHSDVFGALIRLVADPDNRPLVFHCATGKDRTGLGAVLLLAVLGVGWPDIEKDYLLSNDRLGPFTATMINHIETQYEQAGRSLSEGTRAHLEQMMLVDASYLGAARDEMICLDGSVDEYLSGTLGITESTRRSLRRQLLD